jgi:hypothetical protein
MPDLGTSSQRVSGCYTFELAHDIYPGSEWLLYLALCFEHCQDTVLLALTFPSLPQPTSDTLYVRWRALFSFCKRLDSAPLRTCV